MGCCDTGLKKPKDDAENGDNEDKGQDDSIEHGKKSKSVMTWIIVVVLIAGMAIMLI